MHISQLIIELIFDLVAVVLGITLIFKAKDNYQRLYWGLIATLIGIVMLWENIVWIYVAKMDPGYQYTDILNIEKMLKWYAIASIITLFPLASLRPGYLNHFRVTLFLLPTIIVITIGACYISFNGFITGIESMDQIIPNIKNLDVKLRLGIFSLSLLTPLFFFFYPIINNKSNRRITSGMYLLIGFMFFQYIIYIFFTLCINEFFFNGLGITAVVFSIFFSVLFLRSENPFTIHIQKDSECVVESVTVAASALFHEIDRYLKENYLYTDSNLNMGDLSIFSNQKEYVISAAIRSAGYVGFRDYINFMRLEHFREQAALHPKKSVKELMNSCGFTSRATFYRVFVRQYGISPSEYIEKEKYKSI